MTTDRRSRSARRQAAVALLAYVADRTPENEKALLDAAHELEAAAARRRVPRIFEGGGAAHRAHIATSR